MVFTYLVPAGGKKSHTLEQFQLSREHKITIYSNFDIDNDGDLSIK